MTVRDARLSTSSRNTALSVSETVVNSAQPSPTLPESECVHASAASTTTAQTSSSDSSDEGDSSDDELEQRYPEDPIQGWPQLAGLMSKTPDFAAFPRFRDLNVKSLLYYQVQLTKYRKQLHDMEYKNASEGMPWAERADILVDSDSEQWHTVVKMRKVLKEYNRALVDYSAVSALPDPEPFNMLSLRKWLRHRSGANNSVRGTPDLRLQHAWGDLTENPENKTPGLWRQFGHLLWCLIWAQTPSTDDMDLVVTRPPAKIDGLTRWAVCDFVPFWSNFKRHWKEKRDAWRGGGGDRENEAATMDVRTKKKQSLQTWSEKSALRVTSGISTVVACLLPVIAISVLSQLHGLRDLLLCLAGFAVIFAVGLIFLTQGTSTRVEIFAATAAFSAVMVVFISQPPAPIISVSPGVAMPSISPSPVPS